MPATTFGIVHGTVTNIIRRIVEPDDDSLWSSVVLKPNESLKILNLVDFPVRTVATLQSTIGAMTVSPRCVKISALGDVVDIIQADPTVDPVIGVHSVVQTDDGAVGDRYVSGRFQRRYAVAVENVVQSIEWFDLQTPQRLPSHANASLHHVTPATVVGQPVPTVLKAVPSVVGSVEDVEDRME